MKKNVQLTVSVLMIAALIFGAIACAVTQPPIEQLRPDEEPAAIQPPADEPEVGEPPFDEPEACLPPIDEPLDGADYTNGGIMVNGEMLDPALLPYVNGDEGVTMLPLFAIIEKLGLSLVWDEETQSALIADRLTIWVDKDYYTIGSGDPVQFGPAPVLIEDTVYVPLYFFQYALGGYTATIDADGLIVISAMPMN